MDLPSRSKWFDDSRARDLRSRRQTQSRRPGTFCVRMTRNAPDSTASHTSWNLIPYKKVPREKVKLPERSMKNAYDDQASLKGRKFVPEKY